LIHFYKRNKKGVDRWDGTSSQSTTIVQVKNVSCFKTSFEYKILELVKSNMETN